MFHTREGLYYRQALSEYSRSLTLIVDLDQLVENLVGKLQEIVDINAVIILMRDPETGCFSSVAHRGSVSEAYLQKLRFQTTDKLVQWFTVNELTLVTDRQQGVFEYLSSREQELLEQGRIKIAVPLIVMNHVKGMVFLGEKASGRPFERDEMDLLTALLSQSALAFENAILYQEQKQRLRKMFRADRLATIGQIAAGAAHEIRNPLTTIRSSMQYLQSKETDTEKLEVYDGLMGEVDRIDGIIRDLLSFSKPVTPQKEPVELYGLIQQVINLAASYARHDCVDIRFNPPEGEKAVLQADPGQLKQVFVNIVLNAVQAMQGGGTLAIEAEKIYHEPSPGRKQWAIRFSDTGPGIPEEELDQIFDPFFTTKNEGTGLGLSISYGIIKQHGGDISVESRTAGKNRGTCITVMLPRLEQE